MKNTKYLDMVRCVGKKFNTKKVMLYSIIASTLILSPSPRAAGRKTEKIKKNEKVQVESQPINEVGTSGVVEGEIIELPPDIYLVYQCVEAEAGNQDALGKAYVADCIFNRLDSGMYNTLTEVIYAKNQFECVSNSSIRRTPAQDTIDIVNNEYLYRTNTEIKYFRTNYYHKFATPCFKWGAHYFSK